VLLTKAVRRSLKLALALAAWRWQHSFKRPAMMALAAWRWQHGVGRSSSRSQPFAVRTSKYRLSAEF
jgi:hypothetical protein